MPASHADRLSHCDTWSTAAKLLGLFLIIIGAKFWLLRMCSTPLPVFDEWEAEGKYLLLPWLRGQFHFADLFAPWVQHRIVWTRLLVLGLFALNGQWDTQVQAIVAECLHAATAVLLGAILIRRIGKAWEDAIIFCLLLLYSLPFEMENTLSGGFESQYYVLLLCAVVAVWGLATHPSGTVKWWIGLAGAVMAWFSVATGGLPALAVAIWMGLSLACRQSSVRESAATLAVALAVGLGGLALNLGVPSQTPLQAHSAGELLTRFAGLLGWPNPTAWAAPIAYAPLTWVVWRTVRHRQAGRAEAFLIPLGLFTLLNTAALAYARNHYNGLAVSRYTAFLSFGALVNFACLLLLLRTGRKAEAVPRVRAWPGLLTAAWVASTGFGLVQRTMTDAADILPSAKSFYGQQVEHVADFIGRPDPGRFAQYRGTDVLSEKPALVLGLLLDPDIARILPAQARRPVVLEAASRSPLVHQAAQEAGNPNKESWVLEPADGGRPARFCSQTIRGLHAPYLCFPAISNLGDDEAVLALVDERSGETTLLQPGPPSNGWRKAIVKTPSGPFHVEAALAAGTRHSLDFLYPRETGRLSAWVDPILNQSASLLSAGLVLWLGAIFWRRLGWHALVADWRHGSAGEMDLADQVPVIPFRRVDPARRDARCGMRDAG